MRFDLLTIFPDFFRGPLDYGIVRRARESGLIEIHIHDLRAFTKDKHRTVDDRPFGGGEGMVLKPEPIFECVESLGVVPLEHRVARRGWRVLQNDPERRDRSRIELPGVPDPSQIRAEMVVVLSPQGALFDQRLAAKMSEQERIVLICGRYEGIDERVIDYLADTEVSIGDYILSGGELPAAIIVDAVTRLIPGALGNQASAKTESFGAGEVRMKLPTDAEGKRIPDSTISAGGLLDYPHYTRPADFRGFKVPDALVNGDHEGIRRWRRRCALEKTFRNRPELLERAELSDNDRQILRDLEENGC